MLEKTMFNLQLFADGGGDGGDGGSASASVGEALGNDDSGEKKIPASIPEKAHKYYRKAMEKHSGSTTDVATQNSDKGQATNDQGTTDKLSYADLIKSDDYKADHEAYMNKTIGDRLKKYKGIEEELAKSKEMLESVAYKYGLNPADENFHDTLQQKLDEDDSDVEAYAMEHDISNEEARKVLNAERIVARDEARKRIAEQNRQEEEKQEQIRQHIITLRQNAEKTKAQFPDFDLDTEMQNEKFKRLCAATNGDTTSAYMACHWNNILPATVQMASKKIQSQTAQAVASNKARPIENGLSSQAPSVVQQDFSKMNLADIRKYAEEQRRKKAGR
jgi:hypothetical protein